MFSLRSLLSLTAVSGIALLGACGQETSHVVPSELTGGVEYSVDEARLARSIETYGPKSDLTPGDLCTTQDSDFDGYRYRERLPHCARSVSRGRKVTVAKAYGVTEDQMKYYEIDHLIPLSIGGSNSTKNLWPLLGRVARMKSQFEQELHNKVVAGQINQQEAIRLILAWNPKNLAR